MVFFRVYFSLTDAHGSVDVFFMLDAEVEGNHRGDIYMLFKPVQ